LRLFSLYRVELRRLALSKYTWVIAALSLCAPLFGYHIYIQTNTVVTTGKYISSPVLAGAVIGAILWAVLTLLESDRVYRAKTDVLTDTAASPIQTALSRVFALMTLSAAATLICLLVYLPYTLTKVDYLFDFGLYLSSFLVLMLLTWWISILLSAALYQITRRIELAGLLYAGGAYLSLSPYFHSNYFIHWLNPLIVSYSDGYSNAFPLRISFYTRVLWLALAGGLWALSLVCIRRYQKNLAGSFLRGIRKAYIPEIGRAHV
jgi:hypothetical protein